MATKASISKRFNEALRKLDTTIARLAELERDDRSRNGAYKDEGIDYAPGVAATLSRRISFFEARRRTQALACIKAHDRCLAAGVETKPSFDRTAVQKLLQ